MKTSGFLMFPRDRNRDQWLEMEEIFSESHGKLINFFEIGLQMCLRLSSMKIFKNSLETSTMKFVFNDLAD